MTWLTAKISSDYYRHATGKLESAATTAEVPVD
jgi:hypothetical protein